MKTDNKKTMSYDEALAYAKTLHPNATVSLNGSYDTWAISIETNIDVDMKLPAHFDGTPAAVAYAQWESSCDNELLRWASTNGYGWVPLDGLAEIYNLEEKKKTAYYKEVTARQLETFGGSFDWDNADNDTFSAYTAIISETQLKVKAKFAKKQAAWDKKWQM